MRPARSGEGCRPGRRTVGRYGEREEQQHRAQPAQTCRVTGELRRAGHHGHGRDHHCGTCSPVPGMGPRRESRTAAHARRHGCRDQCEDTGTTRVRQVAAERGGEGAQHGVDSLIGPTGQCHRQRRQRHGQRGTQSEGKGTVHALQGERATRGERAPHTGCRRPPTAPDHSREQKTETAHMRYISPASAAGRVIDHRTHRCARVPYRWHVGAQHAPTHSSSPSEKIWRGPGRGRAIGRRRGCACLEL